MGWGFTQAKGESPQVLLSAAMGTPARHRCPEWFSPQVRGCRGGESGGVPSEVVRTGPCVREGDRAVTDSTDKECTVSLWG